MVLLWRAYALPGESLAQVKLCHVKAKEFALRTLALLSSHRERGGGFSRGREATTEGWEGRQL